MAAYQYDIDGRIVTVAGATGSWWYKLDAPLALGDQLGSSYPTRAAARAAARVEIDSRLSTEVPE